MKKKIDAVQLQRTIRAKLSEKYAKSHKVELDELRSTRISIEKEE